MTPSDPSPADPKLLAQFRDREPVALGLHDESGDLFHRGYLVPRHSAHECNPSLRIKCYLSLRIGPTTSTALSGTCPLHRIAAVVLRGNLSLTTADASLAPESIAASPDRGALGIGRVAVQRVHVRQTAGSKKMPQGKRFPRSAFQVSFKGNSLAFVGEREIADQMPRSEPGSVRRSSGVVVAQSGSKITGLSNIVLFPIVNAFDEVMSASAHPASPRLRRTWATVDSLRPTHGKYCTFCMLRAGLPAVAQRAKAGAQGGTRTPMRLSTGF